MAKHIIGDAKIYFGGYDLTGDMNAAELQTGQDAKEKTTFGDAARNFAPGLLSASFSASGFWQAANPDAVFQANIGSGDDILILGTGGDVGDVAYLLKSTLSEYAIRGQVGEMAEFDVSAGARDRAIKAEIALVETITGDGASTAVQLGALTSNQRLWAALMTTASPSGTAPTLDITLESDNGAGFASPATRMTFAQITSRAQQMQSDDGASADDWYRFAWTTGGTTPSLPIVAAFGVISI